MVENYRPISLTCICCKIMESIIKAQTTEFLEKNGLLSKCQFGFRSGKSTSLQLLQCTDYWTKKLDNKTPVDIIYLDFAKAFDTVSHIKLDEKVQRCGIKGDLLLWLRAFLSNRTQRVCVNNTFSSSCNVSSGVPQGSVLGPLMFLIFINDLPDIVCDDVNCVLFADDVKIYRSICSSKDNESLQSTLDKISLWCSRWKLKLSTSKCITLHLGKNNPNFIYTLNREKLETEKSCRDLGVLVSEDCKFSKHINNIVKSAYQKVWQIMKVFESKDAKLLVKAFTTFIRPVLEYCSIIWSPFLLKDINLIEKVQKRFTKRICKNKQASYAQRLKFFDLQSLEERRIKIDLIETFKFMHHTQSRNFEDFFCKSRNSFGQSNKLYVNFSRTDMRKNWFGNRVCFLWNKLPPQIRKAGTLLEFKRLLDSFEVKASFCRGLITKA